MKNENLSVVLPSETTATGSSSILTFYLAGKMVGLPITAVSQIIEIVAITHLPQMPPGIQGAINVHGRIVPVIDLRRRFGLTCTPYHLRTPIILVEVGSRMLALVVDSVDAVYEISSSNLEPSVPSAPYLSGVVQIGEEIVPLVSVENLLTPEEQTQLARILPNPSSPPARNGQAARATAAYL